MSLLVVRQSFPILSARAVDAPKRRCAFTAKYSRPQVLVSLLFLFPLRAAREGAAVASCDGELAFEADSRFLKARSRTEKIS